MQNCSKICRDYANSPKNINKLCKLFIKSKKNALKYANILLNYAKLCTMHKTAEERLRPSQKIAARDLYDKKTGR